MAKKGVHNIAKITGPMRESIQWSIPFFACPVTIKDFFTLFQLLMLALKTVLSWKVCKKYDVIIRFFII